MTASLAGTGSSASSTVTVVTSAAGAPGATDLVLNEVNYDVDTAGNGDANCDGTSDAQDDEFFELSNRSSVPVQLSGVSFWDAAAFTGATPGFTFPSFVLGPGEVVVVFGGLVGRQGPLSGAPASTAPTSAMLVPSVRITRSASTIRAERPFT